MDRINRLDSLLGTLQKLEPLGKQDMACEASPRMTRKGKMSGVSLFLDKEKMIR